MLFACRDLVMSMVGTHQPELLLQRSGRLFDFAVMFRSPITTIGKLRGRYGASEDE
jgi:hypothetical protein